MRKTPKTTVRLILFLLVAAAVALAIGTTSAKAGSNLLGGCSGEQLSQPFLPWLDPDSYTLAPDGSFEGGAAGWALGGGAQVVTGNEPWFVRAASDSRSLYLPTGGRAVSPAICVGLLEPTLRFFSSSLGGAVRVDATLHLGLLTTTVPVGLVAAGGSFAPT